MQFGLIAVTENSTFYIFSSEVVNKIEKFSLLAKWTPILEKEIAFKRIKPTPIHNFLVYDCKQEFLTLVATF